MAFVCTVNNRVFFAISFAACAPSIEVPVDNEPLTGLSNGLTIEILDDFVHYCFFTIEYRLPMSESVS